MLRQDGFQKDGQFLVQMSQTGHHDPILCSVFITILMRTFSDESHTTVIREEQA